EENERRGYLNSRRPAERSAAEREARTMRRAPCRGNSVCIPLARRRHPVDIAAMFEARFQSFEDRADGAASAPRLAALRTELARPAGAAARPGDAARPALRRRTR